MPNTDFSKKLLQWNRKKNLRQMPWKGEKNPYRIWLSEIILQQTRVDQGWAYYERFIRTYPDLKSLAAAKEKEVFKLWEGLGYYSRCRNLLAAAKIIAKDHGGSFPADYEEILALPGIGPYTAAAIASFAFGLPYAVVDANVQRILSRYFGIRLPVKSAEEKKLFQMLADSLLDKKDPGRYNQALMDFGAVVCKPASPSCSSCVQSKNCQAFLHDWVNLLPAKEKAPARKERWFYYFIVEARKGSYFIRERKGNDIWKNLYEFVLWENGKLIPQQQIGKCRFVQENFGKTGFRILHISEEINQTLTHQIIHGCFVHVRLNKQTGRLQEYQLVAAAQLDQYPFPGLISSYLKNSLFSKT
jgi:A/G-specific adenine glycosylase